MMKKKMQKKLQKNQMSYDNAFEKIENFFNYILSFAKVYKDNSEVTIGKLENFMSLLRQDETSFKEDSDWLINNVTAITNEEFQIKLKEIAKLNAKHGQSNENLEKLSVQINATLDEIIELQKGSVAGSGKCNIHNTKRTSGLSIPFLSKGVTSLFASFRLLFHPLG